MAERRFQSIPAPTHVDNEIRKILSAIIDVVERRLLKVSTQNEKMMSRADLLKLGIVTQAQVDSLDRVDTETGA